MNKRATIASGAILLLVFAVAAWAYFRTDPVVAEMQQLRDEMMANRDLPEADRRAQWDNFRQRMDGLDESQRRAVWENGRGRFEQFGRQRMDEFFQLPRAEQQKRLDQIIDRMQARQNNGGGRGGPGRGGRNMSEAQRDQRRKEMISRTDPKMRAQFDQFRQMMGQRMKERGIQGNPGGPWRG